MKCPKCAGREIETTTDEIRFNRSIITVDDDGFRDVNDVKSLGGGDWFIDPDAEAVCRSCHHEGVAREFAEEQDRALVAESLDFFLWCELGAARNEHNREIIELTARLLKARGRPDLALRSPAEARTAESTQ